MDEYIEREALRKHLFECYTDEFFDADMKKAVVGIDVYVEEMPAADVQPVKRGKWEKKRGYLVCSNCGMTVDTIGYTYEEQEEVFRYCSCCGYRMDGEHNG